MDHAQKEVVEGKNNKYQLVHVGVGALYLKDKPLFQQMWGTEGTDNNISFLLRMY